MSQNVKIKLVRPHEHGGKAYPQRAELEVPAMVANKLINNGIAEKATQSQPTFKSRTSSTDD